MLARLSVFACVVCLSGPLAADDVLPLGRFVPDSPKSPELTPSQETPPRDTERTSYYVVRRPAYWHAYYSSPFAPAWGYSTFTAPGFAVSHYSSGFFPAYPYPVYPAAYIAPGPILGLPRLYVVPPPVTYYSYIWGFCADNEPVPARPLNAIPRSAEQQVPGTIPPANTFPYDGGPARPVPMPMPDKPQESVKPLSPVLDSLKVSLPTPTLKPHQYSAYGDKR